MTYFYRFWNHFDFKFPLVIQRGSICEQRIFIIQPATVIVVKLYSFLIVAVPLTPCSEGS